MHETLRVMTFVILGTHNVARAGAGVDTCPVSQSSAIALHFRPRTRLKQPMSIINRTLWRCNMESMLLTGEAKALPIYAPLYPRTIVTAWLSRHS